MTPQYRDPRFMNVVQVQPFPAQTPGESDTELEHELILLSDMVVQSWMNHVQGESKEEADLSSLYAFVRRAYEEQQERRQQRNVTPTPGEQRQRNQHWCARL